MSNDAAVRRAVDRLRNAGGPGSSVTLTHAGRSVTLNADPKRKQPDDKGIYLSDYETLERALAVDKELKQLDEQIANLSRELKGMKEEREARVEELRKIIRREPLPLFDGEPA